jgi:hypothetical protein
MEEADLIADRIAIMACGRLVAEGTPLDLKSRYGVGYTLTVLKHRLQDTDRYHACLLLWGRAWRVLPKFGLALVRPSFLAGCGTKVWPKNNRQAH